MAGHIERTESVRSRRDSAAPLDFSTAKTIGRFELIREIARGGMGQVFLGRDTKLGRKVAIKFLLRNDSHFLQRFFVEARATARCTHENIVTIFEVGEHDGLPYMVLEYLEGKTLAAVIEARPSVRQFCELIVPVVRALERAHEHGIVHRDLKPTNIFVTDRGQVKVLDFGVARLIQHEDGERARASAAVIDASDSGQVTDANIVVGTMPFMSPEQWGADDIDHRSDIWALGIICWRALVRAHPAGTIKPEKLRLKMLDIDTPLPSIGAVDPSLPKPLVAIIDRCLAKHREERYATASELLADLQTFLMPRGERPSAELCPYRGLAAFGENDAKFFFGRDNEIRTALAQLDEWPLLAVIGPSGVGKSSFVHAGLVPALRDDGARWQVHVLRPGRIPLHRLASVLEEAPGHAEHLMQQLVEAPGMFGAMLRDAAIRRGENVVVVVDQLEELFTLCDSDDVRRTFLTALLAAADDPAAPVRVVLSMRADFLDRLATYHHVLAELSRGLFFLAAPDRENLRETLERPAELAGYTFEPGIVDDMLDVATSRGALPLVSFAATRLWESRDRERRVLTAAAYREMGGVAGAFARHADQVAAAVPPQSQPLLRAILSRLVTPEGTRAVVDHRELMSLADRREVERILDQLVRARLIHMHTDATQGATVEIVHEMLITEWPTLARWLEDGNAVRAFQHELRAAAKQWHARGKPSDLLWRGATATEALAQVRRHMLQLSASEHAFIAAIQRRRVIGYASLVAVASIIVIAVAFAFLRITSAEQDAKQQAATAVEAQRALTQKVQQLEAAQRARETAEQQKQAVELDLAQSKQLSREQLEQVNAQLVQQVKESEEARRRAQAKELEAKKATVEAQDAREESERLLEEKRQELEQLKKRKKDIIDVDLTGGSK